MLTTSLQAFLVHAEGAVEALGSTRTCLEQDLQALLRYYGEDPAKTKPEDVFSLITTFSTSLLVSHKRKEVILISELMTIGQRAEQEIEAAARKTKAAASKGADHDSVKKAKSQTTVHVSIAGVDVNREGNCQSYFFPASQSGTGAAETTREKERTISRGGFDEAIRELRSGAGTRRQRSTAGGRPISRVIFDGGSR